MEKGNKIYHYNNLSLEDIEGEVWADIPKYEYLYQVSSFGRVKSVRLKKRNQSVEFTSIPFIMKQAINCGYNFVTFCKDRKRKQFSVHRLVAVAFIQNTENKRTVNHKNGIRVDNRVENLEWATHSENHIHAYQVLKRKHAMKGKFGVDSPTSKKLNQFDVSGTLLKTWDSCADACREYNITPGNMYKCCNGMCKSLRGYKWAYAEVAQVGLIL